MQKYEFMIVFKPILFEDIKTNTISLIIKMVEEMKGELKEVDNMGKRLIAYPIKGFKEGHYMLYELSLNSKQLAEFEKELSLLPDVLRFLVIKK